MSPAGTTRQVSKVIEKTLIQSGLESKILDLGNKKQKLSFLREAASLNSGDCLWIGSPVYSGHAVWPILELLGQLPMVKGVMAVPFVTYGFVKTGFSLLELGEILSSKGFLLAGAAQVLAVHSLALTEENPLGTGHPNKDDLAKIEELASFVTKQQKLSIPSLITLDTLDYQADDHPLRGKKGDINQLKTSREIPTIDESICTNCGICAENCPMDNIDGVNKPVGHDCIFCMNCLRLCPDEAVKHPGKSIFAGKVKELFATTNEPSETRTFYSQS
jgi:NAD-dependent dihydropyrimidine dehydrogenase PreA subunit